MSNNAVLEAQAETQRAFAGLASTRAECNEQHQTITDNITAVQGSVQEGLQVSDQLRKAQNTQTVRVERMVHRLGEMNDLLLQRELRVESQTYELSNQMNSVLNAIDTLRRERFLPRKSGEGVQAGSSSASTSGRPSLVKPSPGNTVKPNLAEVMKPSTSRPAAEVRIKDPMLTMPDTERKPARVQNKGPHDYSSAVQSTVILASTWYQGVDPITIYMDSSTDADLSSTNLF